MDTKMFVTKTCLLSYKKTKYIANKILNYYRSLENSLGNTKYYVISEFDEDDMGVFVSLSMSNMIGIKTKLEKKCAKIILAVLKSILTEDYFIFEEENLIDELTEENIEKIIFFPFNVKSYKELPQIQEQFITSEAEFVEEHFFHQNFFTLNEISVDMKTFGEINLN